MNNVISIKQKGIPTPRYKAQRIMQDRDQDLFVRMVSNDPDHIARAEARKAERIKAIEAEKAQAEWNKKASIIFGQIAIWAIVALLAVIVL